MERRKGMFDEEEKAEEEVPYISSQEEKQEVVIPPKEEEEVKSGSKKAESSEPTDKGFHEVGLAERGGGTTLLSTMEDELNLDFMVGNPEDRSGHIQYYVKGKDLHGEWEGQRRYNHFFFLNEILCQRWPGMYLPRLPPKKAIGRYEVKFL